MLEFLFSPHGRVSRAQIWLGLTLPQLVLLSVGAAADLALAGARLEQDRAGSVTPIPWIGLSIALFFFWPSIVVAVKRFHDRGLSGWWAPGFPLLAAAGGVAAVDGAASPAAVQAAIATAAGLAAMAGALMLQFVILYVLPSEEGTNRYGPARRRRRASPRPVRAEAPAPAPPPAPARMAAAVKPAPRRPLEPCKPVLSTFRGMEAEAARALEPSPLPPGSRSAFGRRGDEA
jgi:uncharacterized membrane protein YhaH (DUF805 family)